VVKNKAHSDSFEVHFAQHLREQKGIQPAHVGKQMSVDILWKGNPSLTCVLCIVVNSLLVSTGEILVNFIKQRMVCCLIFILSELFEMLQFSSSSTNHSFPNCTERPSSPTNSHILNSLYEDASEGECDDQYPRLTYRQPDVHLRTTDRQFSIDSSLRSFSFFFHSQ